MLWPIYSTVNSAESDEFTGAVKYPILYWSLMLLSRASDLLRFFIMGDCVSTGVPALQYHLFLVRQVGAIAEKRSFASFIVLF